MARSARGTVERDEVEQPIIDQLTAMGWKHIHGPDLGSTAPEGDERDYGDVLLHKRLRRAIQRNNQANGATWMTDKDADTAIDALKRAARNVAASSLLSVNSEVTSLLLSGAPIAGSEEHHRGRTVHAQFVDWDMEGLGDGEILERNDFLVVDQLRVRTQDGAESVLDLVLFVNGIPVVVVECKSPDVPDALGEAVRDLRLYAGTPLDSDERDRRQARELGVPELFAPVQLLVAACGTSAALGTITSTEAHFAAWRSVTPDYKNDDELLHVLQGVRRSDNGQRLIEVGGQLTDQHRLVALVLKPRNLLNIVRHYVFEMPVKTRQGEPPVTVKAVCRHQQYRAVEKIVHKLRTGRTLDDSAAEHDERGGVIWHTQGSGKSLTMAFLARRLHTSRDPRLNRFTLLVVTDRKQLEKQLAAAVRISGAVVRVAKSRTDAEGMLKRAGQRGGRAVIFTMIQKFLGRIPGAVGTADGESGDDRDLTAEFDAAQEYIEGGGDAEEASDPTPDAAAVEQVRRRFAECSTDPSVLVLVDEAHRSHTSVLHACLRDALPKAARIGFTGTPIMKGRLTDTGRIFGLEPDGKFLDAYLMDEAERDNVVVPVRYEGRTGSAEVKDQVGLNRKFEDLISQLRADRLQKQKLRKRLTPTSRDVAESEPMIARKALDMMEHYVTGPLTGGFKAQVAAVSRKAAVLYRHKLDDARRELLARIADFDPASLRDKPLPEYTWDDLVLLRTWQYQEVLRRIDFVPVISASKKDDRVWEAWTDSDRQDVAVERFLEPFPQLPPDNPWAAGYTPHTDDSDDPTDTGGTNPWSDTDVDTEEEVRPVAFLIVKSMLLTGFDAPIEQVLYLDRPIQDAELLQAIARVNRPRRDKKFGRVVDYYGVLDNLADTLPAYKGEGPTQRMARGMVQSLSDDLPELDRSARELSEFLEGMGITGLDSAHGLKRGMLALDDEGDRAEFDRLLGAFMNALERVLPHQSALDRVPDARQWTLLQKRVRRHYRDAEGGDFSLRAYGRQVRAMVADHLELAEVEQVIAPVSILAPDFDEVVGRITDVEESAAEQVQALRYHLEERREEDDRPVLRTLSQELERILQEFEGRWDEIQVRIGPLIERAREAERVDPVVADMTPVEQQLYTKLSDCLNENPAFDVPGPATLRYVTKELGGVIVEHVSRAAWSDSEASLGALQSALWVRLRQVKIRPRAGERQALRDVSNALAAHAKRHAAAFRAAPRGQ
ncbi:type I restriction endonuclease [Streptomyces sp. AcE210]|uniref:type I restriction endonuclease subunit R n=1 Tax=Streptomyces sp. AcE210 TaxID=2292703 RepID=UPI000E3087B2|nr:type I restriction endonuclease [Streptomyces sp. AcE210]RFC72755.1 type I restriction endonuclease subunit R [Streptomyces sp. AcE210]